MSSTVRRNLSTEAKTLRAACENAVPIRAVFLQHQENFREVSTICESFTEVEEWHTTQNVELRSSEDTLAWLKEQHNGEFWNHINRTMQHLESPSSLERCLFWMPNSQSPPSAPEGLVATEEAFATAALEAVQ